jgi:hypothetical protein
MRNLLIILSLLSLTCNAQQLNDKQLHLMVGTSLGAWSYLASPKQEGIIPVAFCITGATLAGWGKEAYDRSQGMTFDKKDLAYTIAGGVISAITIVTVKKIIRKNRIRKINNYRR